MIPTRFVALAQMPLTRSGKVNVRALPPPDRSRPRLAQAYVGPRDALEETVAAVWREVLDLDRVGVHDSFLDLGGQSLLAARISARLREAFQVDVPLRTVFESPTVAGMAATLARRRIQAADAQQLEQWVAELESMPAEEVEQRLRGQRGEQP
jgi:hypothetical protein